MTSSGTGARSEARRSSNRVVPVHSRSMLGAPPRVFSSSRWAVRKSMLKRVLPEVLFTDECRWAPEKRISPPGGTTTRSSGSSSSGSSGFGCLRVSALTSLEAVGPAGLVPLVVVVLVRGVRDRHVPILRVEGERALRLERKDRQPPIELTGR